MNYILKVFMSKVEWTYDKTVRVCQVGYGAAKSLRRAQLKQHIFVTVLLRWKKMVQKFFILKRLRNLSISWGEFCLDTSDHVLHLDTYIRNRGQKNEIHGRIFTLGMGGTGNMIRISGVYLSRYLNKLLIC